MCTDGDRVTGCGRDAAALRVEWMWLLDSPRIRGRDRAPDAKPGIIRILGDEDAIVRTPVDGILPIPDAETIGIPSGAQISLDLPLNAQCRARSDVFLKRYWTIRPDGDPD